MAWRVGPGTADYLAHLVDVEPNGDPLPEHPWQGVIAWCGHEIFPRARRDGHKLCPGCYRNLKAPWRAERDPVVVVR